jgi:hypothetical protein
MRARLLVLLLAALAGSACLVQIEHVRDPRPQFAAARREAERLQGRKGPAKELNVLVYDASDRKLVRVSIPMWLARRIEEKVDWDKEIDWDVDERDRDRYARSLRRHVNLREIEKAGLGLLVEVDEEGGEQVLVWLR